MLVNPLDSVVTEITAGSTEDSPGKETSAVSNDIVGQCPVCQGKMTILKCGNETEAYVCMDDRVAIPVPSDHCI